MIDRSLNQAPPLSGVKLARRDKILAACEALFVAQGFRGTTIEALAEAASISKVTMYGYFRDKDAVFVAVAECLASRLQSVVMAELERDGPAAERIAAALTAKHIMVFDIVRRSPFASELFQAKDAHVAQLFKQLDAAIIDLMVDVLSTNSANANHGRELAQLMFAAANGIASFASDGAQCARQIEMLVTALVKD